MARRVTIKDIASELDVSANTVSKALNGKPKVGDELRKLVIATANSMGYIPNRSAKAISGKRIRIAVVHSREPRSFVSYLEDGFREALDAFIDYRLELEYFVYDRLNDGEKMDEMLRKAAASGADGIICHLGFSPEKYGATLRRIIDGGTPVLMLVSGMDYDGAIGMVQLNPLVTGALAAQFLGMTVGRYRKAAVIVGKKGFTTHEECVRSFCASGAEYNLELAGQYEAMEDDRTAYELTGKIAAEQPELGGIYVSSCNSVGVCQWYEDHPEVRKPVIIGHDLYPEVIEKLKNGSLEATIYQNQTRSARRSVQIMLEYLSGVRPEDKCSEFVAPQLILKSHVSGDSPRTISAMTSNT